MAKIIGLLTHATENVVVAPVVGEAGDAHARPAAPATERGETVLAVLVLPVNGVGVLGGEVGVGFVHGGHGDRVGLEAEVAILGRQPVVGHDAIHEGARPRLEETDFDHLDALGLGPGHGIHHGLVDVLPPAGGVEGLLRGAGAVDGDVAGDQAGEGLDAGADHGHELLGELLTLGLEHLLGGHARDP